MTNDRREFRVELYVDAVDEKAVWMLLKQLTNIDGAGLSEEPIVEEVEGECWSPRYRTQLRQGAERAGH